MYVHDFIADQNVSDSGQHTSAAASLPVQPSRTLSQNERSCTSKQPLATNQERIKRKKLERDIQVNNILCIIC